MEFLLIRVSAFLTLTLVATASHATTLVTTQFYYWNSVLPDTPMPKALSQLVQPDHTSVGKGDLSIFSQDAAQNGCWPHFIGYSRGTKNEDPSQVFFFLEKDMHLENTKKYGLAKSSNRASFLSRKTAESIPFSSRKMPEILNQYSLKSGSVEAIRMKETIQECESQGVKGEEKQCVTSLESMIDYATSKLGKNIQAVSTEVEKGDAAVQNYTISPGVKKLSVDDRKQLIVCHKMNYPYAVFYCHAFGRIRVYMVPLQGSDGMTAKAVAICHTDTSGWNAKIFQDLKVEPGTIPICHFPPEGEIAWVQNPSWLT